jgi:hypothetical protein
VATQRRGEQLLDGTARAVRRRRPCHVQRGGSECRRCGAGLGGNLSRQAGARWSIGEPEATGAGDADDQDASDLYRKLQHVIAPLFYDDHSGWTRVMRHAIALKGSFFNTDGTVRQYVQHAYAPTAAPASLEDTRAAKNPKEG